MSNDKVGKMILLENLVVPCGTATVEAIKHQLIYLGFIQLKFSMSIDFNREKVINNFEVKETAYCILQ